METGVIDTGITDAIIEGRHGDAFAVLGPHQTPDQTGSLKGGYEFTAWLPQAEAAHILSHGVESAMLRVHPSGMYRALIPSRDYQLRVQHYSGETQIIEDPYRFSPLLTPFEL